MTVKERLKKFVEFKKMSDRQFSFSIGVSAGYINSINKSIQPDKLSRIAAQYPELNTLWLLTGEGQMLKENDAKPALDADKIEMSREIFEQISLLTNVVATQQNTIAALQDTITQMNETLKQEGKAGTVKSVRKTRGQSIGSDHNQNKK